MRVRHVNKDYEGIVKGIEKFIEACGPKPEQYPEYAALMRKVAAYKRNHGAAEEFIEELQKKFGEAMTTCKTLQGQVCVKPYGYPGDFEIIDKIYTKYISPDKMFRKWDRYFQAQAAPNAVRNRKEYFKEVLRLKPNKSKVLCLVNGPSRDIMEFMVENDNKGFEFDTVENDLEAIVYAKKLFKIHCVPTTNIKFIRQKIHQFTPKRQYDVIWSSGLFDYLDERFFVGVLRKLMPFLTANGEIIIGNFHPSNPSKDYMEFGQWYLNYRTEEDLKKIAVMAGIKEQSISIDREDKGVNLFMRIQKK